MGTGPKNIDTILSEAVEIESATDRSAFLDEACGGDSQLRQRLDKLVSDHFRAGSVFLEQPPAAFRATLDQPITEKPGTQIGPYKLLQQIGEGGMGVVYMAEQKEPVKRRVALKIIKPGMDTRQVIARFEAERQALAMMDHPNIAKVLDAGATESGRPYFVMELVNGVSITQYCDEQHLTPKERLELFVPICQAVQHAHQKGIIHRDLKPSNILVAEYDHRAVPKIIDFGVAKATSQTLTEKTMFTQLGQIVGTLEYMSPEQAKRNQLDVDTRSDVYSLGVVLYELLTGETPFDRERLRSAAFDEMLRIIREEEPSKPSTKVSSSQSLPSIAANRHIEPAKLSSMIRGELDWIVLKAMEKDRGRRYETASKFAEDVQHYLSDEPVVACPPAVSYRLRKFARRNRGPLVMAGALGVALLVAMSGIGWAIRDRAAQRAEVARQQDARDAEIAREHEQRRNRIRIQVDLSLAEADRLLQQQKFPEAFAAAKQAQTVIEGGDAPEDRTKRVRQVLNNLSMVESLEQIRLTRSVIAWQDTSQRMGFDYEGSDRQYSAVFRQHGIDINKVPVTEAAESLRSRASILSVLVYALDDWAYCRRKINHKKNESLTELAQALDLDPWRGRFRSAVSASDWKALKELAASDEIWLQPPGVIVLMGWGLADGAGEDAGDANSAAKILQRASDLNPSDFWINYALADILRRCQPPRLEEAETYSRVALALRPSSAGAYANLGLVLDDRGKLEESIVSYERALKLEPRFAGAHNNLGLVLSEQDKLDLAIASYRKALDLEPNLAVTHYNIGNVLRRKGRMDEAIACYEHAIELNPEYVDAHYNLGITLQEQSKQDMAHACYRRTIELDPKHVWAHVRLGDILDAQGKPEEAIICYRKAIKLDPNEARAYNNLGTTLYDMHQRDEAIVCFRKAIKLDPEFAYAYCNLGNALARQGKLDEATECHRRAIELDPNYVPAHSNLAATLCGKDKLNEAIASGKKAITVDPNYAPAHRNLGTALARQGKLVEAIACFRKAIELDPKNVEVYSNLGAALQDTNQLDDAIACYRKAIELDPNYTPAYRNLGIAEYRVGNWQAAVAALEKVDKMTAGGDSVHRMFYAMAQWQSGDRDQARKVYAQGAAWIAEHSNGNVEPMRFQVEAEELMGITVEERNRLIAEYQALSKERSDSEDTVPATGKTDPKGDRPQQ